MHSNWQVDFFRGVALDVWRLAIPPEQTQAEVDFLERVFNAAPGAHFLDVPCGNGRHAIELANRGYAITGVDLSEEFLDEARSRSPVPIEWVHADMRELPWLSDFDGAYCFGNSFGYLDSASAREFLGAVACALKPGARFVIETGMAAESILPGLGKGRWFKVGEIYMLSENRYHPSEGRLDIEYTFIRDGQVDTRPSSSYVFTVAEICRMHQEAGLDVIELLGSIAGEAFEIGSQRLIAISAKPL